MVKSSYIYGCSVYYINGQILLHLWFVDLLHLWLKVITFMVFITFMGDTASGRLDPEISCILSLLHQKMTEMSYHL